jgi:hypothetical protein
MAAPVWVTTAGSLGIINERDYFSSQLEALDADSTALTYSKIAGNLPPGIELTTAGTLRGVPFEVSTRSLYNFVVRVSDGTNIADRTFSLQVKGADAPSFATASGQLDLSDSSRVGNQWVLDGSYIEYQILATDTDTAAGQQLAYDIASGSLPPGITMSPSGLISGVVLLTDDERYGPIGGYDNIFDYDDEPYDPESRSVSRSQNFEFVVRVTDGVSIVTQVNSIFVFTADFWRVDNNRITVDQTTFDTFPLVMSLSANRRPVFQTSGNLGTFRHDNQCVIKIDVVDFDTVQESKFFAGDGSTSTFNIGDMVDFDLVVKINDVAKTLTTHYTVNTTTRTITFLSTPAAGTSITVNSPATASSKKTFLEYSIVGGALPPGLSIDINSGEIFGQLPQQTAVESEYSFTVRASRAPLSGITVFADKTFTMSVIGSIDIGIAFVTNTDLGTIIPGIPSLFSVQAEAAESNRVLNYSITSGSLPTGLSLSTQGNIIGNVDLSEFTTVDSNLITFDSNSMSFDRKYSFTISVSDQYQSLASSKVFTLTVKLPYGKEYGNMTAKGLLSNKINSIPDADLFYSIAQDPNINNDTYIFRSEDPNFGVRQNADMLLVAGLEHQTLNVLQLAMEKNHEPKTLYFGDIKTAAAKQNGSVVYEVVYLEMVDNLVNNSGVPISNVVTLSPDIRRPLLGPLADVSRITADFDTYTVTTDGGLSYSIAGSKIRYSNVLSADIGAFEKLFPNAVAHMRKELKDLGQKEFVHLPLWMRSAQGTSGTPLGYKMAVVLAYCKPGMSGLVRKRVLDKNIDFRKILFRIDRYVVNASKVDTGDILADGSTKNFTLNEIVHEEDIKIRENATTLIYGDQVTADNEERPTYLSADSLLRSADYEPQFYLSHDISNKKTTVNFTNAPPSNAKIRIERRGDKYLVFKRKLKE